ncbi:hypothetical protein GUJ93_ZPchr0036g6509 [Zizania palustris]|uniref:Uncharacterized protein n=1 Tax=Zizania palustris TaxID=103762 RepID=A0A8J5UZY1_ZIZPA|nr:hypothetical protein GUJ93_ZPchr0036g6509 [Zizania palustris]
MPMPELLPDALQDEEDTAESAARVRKPSKRYIGPEWAVCGNTRLRDYKSPWPDYRLRWRNWERARIRRMIKALYPKVLVEVWRLEASDLNSARRSMKKEKGQR